MNFVSGHIAREHDICQLFLTTFTASEGADEGQVIGKFVADLMATTSQENLFVFSAYAHGSLVGGVFFSRINYAQDNRTVFILSPMAVKSDRQKNGIGQKLIAFGLDELARNGVDVALTYGDPNFYSKIGFRQITTEFAQAPFELSQPEGWLAQSLTQKVLAPLVGSATCVDALNKPELW